MTAMRRTVIKHPASGYLIVAFVALCATALVRSPIQLLVYLIPLAGAAFLARTATVVDERGITAQGLFGSQLVTWDEIAGLRLDPSGSVYAVDRSGGQVRLPCIRSTRLDALVAAGRGRIPDPAKSGG